MFIMVTDRDAHKIRININNIAYYHEYSQSSSDLRSRIILKQVAYEAADKNINTMESPKEIDNLINSAMKNKTEIQ